MSCLERDDFDLGHDGHRCPEVDTLGIPGGPAVSEFSSVIFGVLVVQGMVT